MTRTEAKLINNLINENTELQNKVEEVTKENTELKERLDQTQEVIDYLLMI